MYFSACSELKEGLLLVHRLKKEGMVQVFWTAGRIDSSFRIGRNDWYGFSDWEERLIRVLRLTGLLSTEFLMYIGWLRNSPSSQTVREDLSKFSDWEEGLIQVPRLLGKIYPSSQTVRKDLSKFSDWEEGLIQVLWLGRRIYPGTQI